MPLTVNVGLSRKTSIDFQSQGLSINLTAELDQSLLSRPSELQQQIRQLYNLADQALDRQAAAAQASTAESQSQAASSSARHTAPSPSRNRSWQTSPRNGNGRQAHSGGGAMTQSQRRAIDAIGRRLGLEVEVECRDALAFDPNNLSIRQASQLIDHLRDLEHQVAPETAAGNGNGSRFSGQNGGGR